MGQILGRKVYRQVRLENGDFEFVEISAPAPLPSELIFKEPFRSPIDGRIIRNKRELHDHNVRHGVMQQVPGLDQDVAARRKELRSHIDGPVGKRERINELLRAYDKHSREK